MYLDSILIVIYICREAGHECGAKGGANRRVRRVYLRQELASLLHLLSDKPALLGPKFQVKQNNLIMYIDIFFL